MSQDSVSRSASAFRLPVYNGKSSFSAWKHKVLAYLQSIGLKDAVVGPGARAQVLTAGVPVGSASAVSTSSHVSVDVKRSEEAYALLLNLLDDTLIDLVSSVPCGDAAGVWKLLLYTYESKSTAHLCAKMDEAMNLRFEPARENFDLFKARFTNLCVELKDLGEPLSAKIQRYVLLRAMPAQYEVLVQSLKVNDGLALEEVCVHIKEYCESEKRRTSHEEAGHAAATAFAMTAGQRRRNVKNADRDSTSTHSECYLCGRAGHVSKSCPLKNGMLCSSCGATGHTSRRCETANNREGKRFAGPDDDDPGTEIIL
jgi:hypothetical protein